uniref:retropepsin-like aspartic protease n=1 Tax=Cysteiniphilum litorale TaxID=2056700 RepID=UPI003F882687
MTAEAATTSKRARLDTPDIWFSAKDLDGVQLPHNDPLVLTLRLKKHLVQRVLVDPGSSSEILYYDCFKRMGLKDEDLEPSRTPLVGFSSKAVYPKGKLSLKVQVGGAARMTDFLVVDAPSPYNAIMGRSWLHSMEAVPSTYHQKLKFPQESANSHVEVVTVRGDQDAAKQCLV